jgi:hypothetical protein
MNTLSEELINKIMLYVSHPCADILNNAIEKVEDSEDRFINEKNKTFTFINDYDILPHYDNPQYYEYDYEFEVVRRHIYNKLQVWAITEDDILRLCPEYLHMNRKIIMGLINEDAERIEASEIENDYETGYYEPREYI